MFFSFQDFDAWFNASNIEGNTQLVERLHAVSTMYKPIGPDRQKLSVKNCEYFLIETVLLSITQHVSVRK